LLIRFKAIVYDSFFLRFVKKKFVYEKKETCGKYEIRNLSYGGGRRAEKMRHLKEEDDDAAAASMLLRKVHTVSGL
jgi:hypothetical protein